MHLSKGKWKVNELLSASEIAALKLPNLPTTKVAIAARAEREGWYSEERKGLGGTRKVYQVPERYLQQAEAQPSGVMPESPIPSEEEPQGKVIGTITPGGRSIDLETMKFVDAVLEEWLQKKGLRLKPERRAGVLAVLCDYLAKGATQQELQEMLKVLSA